MKKILIDVDEVICHAGFLPLINKFLNKDYKLEQFTNYYIDDDIFTNEKEKIDFFNYYVKEDGYKDATLLEGAYEALEKISAVYEIYICSAFVMDGYENLSGKFILDKYNYLINTFPFLKSKNFIFTGAKNLFKADVQIDDRLSNLKGEVSLKLLFSSYHNKNISDSELQKEGAVRVNSWKEILTLLSLN